MKRIRVLDSYSLLVYLEKGSGYEKMIDLFQAAADSNKNHLLSVVNWGEVYYIVLREYGELRAQEVLKIIDTLPIEIVDVDREIVRIAASFKASKSMSYAGCFAAALAKLKNLRLVTGDREFETLKDEIKIDWL